MSNNVVIDKRWLLLRNGVGSSLFAMMPNFSSSRRLASTRSTKCKATGICNFAVFVIIICFSFCFHFAVVVLYLLSYLSTMAASLKCGWFKSYACDFHG